MIKRASLYILKMFGLTMLHLSACIIIVLDLFYMNINEIAAIVITVIWAILLWALSIYLGRKRKLSQKRRVGRGIYFAVIDILVILLMVVATELNMYWNSELLRNNKWTDDSGNKVVTRAEALEDYEFAMKYLKKVHPNTIDGLPSDVEKKAAEVKTYLESVDTIKGYELARELESIFALLNDGHTIVKEMYDDYHYMKHMYEHEAKGDKLVGINGITLEEFLESDKRPESYEREAYGIESITQRVATLEGLKYLGLDTNKDITYNFINVDGENVDEVVFAKDFFMKEDYLNYEELVTGDNLHEEKSKDFVSYEIDKKHSLVILTLDSCKYNDHYREVVAQMFDDVEKNGIENIAVDLRANSGGMSKVADEFINYLDVDEYRGWASELRAGWFKFISDAKTYKNQRKGAGFKGNVYILTSVLTYSSAMDFAMFIQDNRLGKVVGESCGNMPASCGEVAHFKLPNSGLYMQISGVKWFRIDETKSGMPIIPDYECDADDAYDELIRIIEE